MIRHFKGRDLNPQLLVQVYRNLNGGEKRRWSIRQGGVVIAHANRLGLVRARFHVGKAGQRRALRQKRRNVHAWAEGYVDTRRQGPPRFPQHAVRYSLPNAVFLDQNGFDIWAAEKVWFTPDKVLANGADHYREQP